MYKNKSNVAMNETSLIVNPITGNYCVSIIYDERNHNATGKCIKESGVSYQIGAFIADTLIKSVGILLSIRFIHQSFDKQLLAPVYKMISPIAVSYFTYLFSTVEKSVEYIPMEKEFVDYYNELRINQTGIADLCSPEAEALEDEFNELNSRCTGMLVPLDIVEERHNSECCNNSQHSPF